MRIQVQRGILCLGLLLIAGSGLYAPWDHTWQASGISQVVKPAPRAWLFRPPHPKTTKSNMALEAKRTALKAYESDNPSLKYATNLLEAKVQDPREGTVLALKRLAVEWLVIAAATGASLVLTSKRHGERESRPAT